MFLVCAHNGVIRRIDENGIIKVADFGLTEDMYNSDYYRQEKREPGAEEKVPIKWMAPESIETHVFDESTSFVMWYILSPLFSASSSSLSFILFYFNFYSCGCIRVYQWSVQEPLSPRLATGYSPVDHWCSLSVLFLFSLAPNFGVFNNNNNMRSEC